MEWYFIANPSACHQYTDCYCLRRCSSCWRRHCLFSITCFSSALKRRKIERKRKGRNNSRGETACYPCLVAAVGALPQHWGTLSWKKEGFDGGSLGLLTVWAIFLAHVGAGKICTGSHTPQRSKETQLKYDYDNRVNSLL